eukprot:TRINITY_DN12043_c0_g2_i1.p2 TRINITY_DN12043_c0_g2~~TRINITY_DN12043_c0_g2_i1.p2  ORF type:complete len:155 (+),score=38.03 TRINITY_DN12043_c0_g2_i1:53-517(+)
MAVSPVTVSSLAGRWMVHRGPGDEGLAIVKEDGNVAIVGEALDVEIVLEAVEGGDGRSFTLQQMPEKEVLCDVKLSLDESDAQVLTLKGSDGYEETWRRTAAQDGSPKIVTRSAGSIKRRWTRETPSTPKDDDPVGDKTEIVPDASAAAGTGES